jgi:hypothetical protein
MGRPKGAPSPKWKVDAENGVRKIRIVNWIEVAQDTDGGATKDKEKFGRVNINHRLTVLTRSKYFNGTLPLSQV